MRRTTPAGASASGFTLFEVMISLLVLTVAILSTIALMPVGLRALQLSRSQMYAATAVMNMGNSFHNMVPKIALGQTTPNYFVEPWGNTNPSLPPATLPGYGWAGQLRNTNLYSSPYQPNAEQDLGGWFKGVLPVPLEIARRLDSENDEIQRVLDQGGMLCYPDPNFMTGLNSGAALDKTMQTLPSSELQRLVFAWTSLPQQNLLASIPSESLPWYEVYPFPPAWLSMEAVGIETRKLAVLGGPVGEKSAVTVRGRGTGDWTWGGGMVDKDDGGHSRYEPVYWRLPSTMSQHAWSSWHDKEKPLDDPNAYDVGDNGGANDWDKGWYQGCGWYQGRNWRYFSANMGGLWKQGNGIPSTDPAYGASSSEWAYVCFQRLSGGDDQWLGYPRGAYTNTRNDAPATTREGLPAGTTTAIIDPLNNALTPSFSTPTVNAKPTSSWSGHAPAKYCRAGWLPIRGLQDNQTQVRYDDTLGNLYKPDGNIDVGVTMRSNQPQTCRPPATYEMRANYRDRAIDLWQAVMPRSSGCTVMAKNLNALVDLDQGGTMVDCDKYEYPPSELSRFKMVMPSDINALDWPIHPSQVLALSYLAHAAMMVTGYGPPFTQDLTQTAQVNTIKIAWEGLNWTYMRNPEESAIPEVATDQGITKDALIAASDAGAGATTITIRNDTPNPYVLYPGDEIMFAESYEQWWYRYGLPQRGDGNIWAYREAACMAGGIYDNPPIAFPNMNYQLHTFRVVAFNGNSGVPGAIPGGSTATITFTPPLPAYPADLHDATANPTLGGTSVHAGSQIRRICNEADKAFARKVYEMCLAWAKAYASEEPYDCGAPRMANHQTMMDKPLCQFDLFWDAANGIASGPDGQAVRVPMNYQQWSNNPTRYSKESFYRWMVPNNHVPDTFFWKGVPPPGTSRHDLSNLGPGTWGRKGWDVMVHNAQLAPPSIDNDQKRFWPVKPFAPFHRARQLSFWSADWKAFADAEIVPSAPVDWARQNMQIYNYWWLFPNGGLGTVNTFCGIPESLYAWTNPKRVTRFVDVASSEGGGQLWQNAQGAIPNDNPWTPPGADKVITFDTRMGHWGADRNGNGRLDIGPIPKGSRMRASKIADFVFYDPIMRLNVSN